MTYTDAEKFCHDRTASEKIRTAGMDSCGIVPPHSQTRVIVADLWPFPVSNPEIR
jgi:hypothetical protein